nr:hypothetical protein [Hyphomonas sp. Mor2]
MRDDVDQGVQKIRTAMHVSDRIDRCREWQLRGMDDAAFEMMMGTTGRFAAVDIAEALELCHGSRRRFGSAERLGLAAPHEWEKPKQRREEPCQFFIQIVHQKL